MGQTKMKRKSETFRSIDKDVWDELNKLTEEQLDKLFDIMGIGVNELEGEPWDRDDKILIISTESEDKIKEGLKKLAE